MAVRGLPPSREEKANTAAGAGDAKDEKLIKDFIKKGGSVSKTSLEPEADKLKAMNVKLYQSELDKINKARDKRPKRDRPSIHDWILEAIKEKLEREV